MAINISGTAGVTPTQWTTAGRPANPNLGQSGWNTTIGGLEFYVGNGNWQTVVSTAYNIDYLVVAGGGGSNYYGAGGGAGGFLTGGSGVVIIRYAGSTARASGGTIVVAGGYVVHTFTSSGNFIA